MRSFGFTSSCLRTMIRLGLGGVNRASEEKIVVDNGQNLDMHRLNGVLLVNVKDKKWTPQNVIGTPEHGINCLVFAVLMP